MRRPTRDASSGTPSLSRRSALRILGTSLGGAALGGALLLPSCSPPDGGGGPPPPAEIPLAELPLGERVRVMHGETPVELLRSEGGITARSLLCTHFGCEVHWVEEKGQYHCPCHEGRFDEAGRPVAGPPPRPLRLLPARVEGDRVIVGEALTS